MERPEIAEGPNNRVDHYDSPADGRTEGHACRWKERIDHMAIRDEVRERAKGRCNAMLRGDWEMNGRTAGGPYTLGNVVAMC